MTSVDYPNGTVEDLKELTGLKNEMAKLCFETNGCYSAALASFVQSYATLPRDAFDSDTAVVANTKKINEQLRQIYQTGREWKQTGKCQSDQDVWNTMAGKASTAPPTEKDNNKKPAEVTKPATPPPSTTPNVEKKEEKTTAKPDSTPSAPSGGAGGKSAAPVFAFGSAKSTPAGTDGKTAAPAFSFGSKATSAAPAFSFGDKKPSAGGDTAAPVFAFGSKPADSKKETAAPEVEGAVVKEEAKKPVVYCEPTHFTGPFFEMPNFWEKEVVAQAPLFNLDRGFLAANRNVLRERLEKWVKKASFYRKPIQYVKIEDEDEEVVRVIIKDAERTFYETEHRQKLIAFLNALYHEFDSYGQAMSYLAGLCLLVLNEEETGAVIRFVATEYIKGHWAAEAVGFATSAWVVEAFMQRKYKNVAEHLMSLNFWPDTYLQKILSGLCIHMLPFEQLFVFLDAFMAGGMKYLIQFCLAIVEHFQSDLLAIKSANDANNLYEIMRLDSKTCDPSDVDAILKRAPHIDLGEAGSSIDIIRSEVYEKRVSPRIARAPKTDTFEPCDECEKNRPKWWNDDLGALCDACKEKHPDETFEKY